MIFIKTIQFQDLNSISFDIHDIIIIDHHWEAGETFTTPDGGRPDNGIMFINDVEFEYIDESGNIYDRAIRNDIVYTPKLSEYNCHFDITGSHKTERTSDYLINFLVYGENGEELRFADDKMIITPKNPQYYHDSFNRIDSLGRRGLTTNPQIKSMLYGLLSDIAFELQRKELMTRRYAAIYPAVKYLRTTDLAKIDTSCLAKLCHLSESGFRRLFREYYGMPPLEYLNYLKVSQARMWLNSGELSVADVAESLGFSDASYFSRFYKKATGHSPREDMR
ncbi:MAG: helix-turn-helix transcriptional regulator [Clostridiales bacterium]|nr:helix-turn-helix transcriptional regulator [Clostridiales bacterium]